MNRRGTGCYWNTEGVNSNDTGSFSLDKPVKCHYDE